MRRPTWGDPLFADSLADKRAGNIRQNAVGMVNGELIRRSLQANERPPMNDPDMSGGGSLAYRSPRYLR